MVETLRDTTIEGKIILANINMYALMGTGLHGTNGIGALPCCHIFNTYVMPRLLYGLEIAVLSQAPINKLSQGAQTTPRPPSADSHCSSIHPSW